ncbi:MAG: acyl carrier protein [Pseudonocardiaceae bacterium]
MQKFTVDHLQELFSAALGIDAAAALHGDVLDRPFAELGYDSLALLELCGHVQRTFGVPMPDEAPQHMPTPRAALDYINACFVEAGV